MVTNIKDGSHRKFSTTKNSSNNNPPYTSKLLISKLKFSNAIFFVGLKVFIINICFVIYKCGMLMSWNINRKLNFVQVI